MSYPAYFSEISNIVPVWSVRPAISKGLTYSEAPLCFHPETTQFTVLEPLCSPLILTPWVLLPSVLPVAHNPGARMCNYWTTNTTAVNTSGMPIIENHNTVSKPQGETPLHKNKLLISRCCSESELKETVFAPIASSDKSDPCTMEHREYSSAKSGMEVFTELYYAVDQPDKIECSDSLSSELPEGISSSVSGQSCSMSIPELKFPDASLACFSSTLDVELETYEKKRGILSKVCKDKSEANVLGEVCNNICFCYEVSDYRQKIDVDEDSQLEYHSAEEQDYSGLNTSYMPFEQMKTQGGQNSEVLELVDTVSEVICDGATSGQNPVSKVDNGSFPMGYDGLDEVYNEAEIPQFSKLSQDPISQMDYEGLRYESREEEQTDDAYHSALDEKSFESDSVVSSQKAHHKSLSLSSSGNQQKMESVSFCSDAQSSQMAIKKAIKRRDGNSMLQKHGNTCERSSETSTQASSKNANLSSCSYEESFLSASNSDCHDYNQKNVEMKPDFSFALTRIPVKDSCLSCAEVLDKYAGDSIRHQANFSNSEIKCLTCLNNGTGYCKVTVNQTVDASSDFRACFTTSRATSASASEVYKANNTKLMMNRTRSVACNTDLSCIDGSMEQIASQLTETWGNCINSNILTTERSSQIKDPLKLSLRDPDRISHLNKELEKTYSSNCCRMMLERAIKAELQLLRTHYWMCCQHCWKINRLVMEEKECFNRSFKNDIDKNELGSSLLSIFEELKARYENMREELVKGIPLDSMAPLSVESKLISVFSSYIPSKLVKDDHLHNSGSGAEKSGLEMSKHQESEISSTMKRTPSLVTHQMMCLTDNKQSKQPPSYKNFEIKCEDQDVKSDCRKSQEINEDWFDAKENFTVTDFSATLQGNEKEQENLEKVISTADELEYSIDLVPETKMAKNTRSEPNKHYFIHVGGLSPLVSEADLRYHFQKYQVLEVSICEFSSNYRYASLSFKKASEAKLAVEEMNEKKIKGKTVNVRLVKITGENTFPASQKGSRPLHSENQPTVNLGKNTEVRTTRCDFDTLKVPSTTSTSLKVLAPPLASTVVPAPILTSSTVLNSNLKSPTHESGHLLFSVDQQSIKENPLQIKSVQFSPNPSATFIPPNTLNLSSFTKLMKKLKELHPKATSDNIVDALLEVRTNNNGFLSGLSINAIVEMASFVLKKSASKCEKK